MFAAVQDAARVARFDASACSNCSCSPAWLSGAIVVGQANTVPRAAVVVGSSIYLAGFTYQPGNSDYSAFVARVDLSSGNVVGAFQWNPTGLIDGFLGLATDGQKLYAAGGRGWDGSATWASSTGTVMALPLSIASSTTPLWTASVPSIDVAHGLTVGTGAGLFLAGEVGGSGVVVRCTKGGVCP